MSKESSYDLGLDVLGAGLGLARSTGAGAPDPAKVSAAGQRAMAAAARLAKRRPQTAQRLAAIGQRTLKRAATAKTVVKAAKTAATARAIAQTLTARPATTRGPVRAGTSARTVAHAAQARSRLLGDALQNHLEQPSTGPPLTAQALSPEAIRALIDAMNQTNAAAQAGEIENAIIATGNTIPTGHDDLVQSGQAIVDRCDQLIVSVSSDQGDPSAVATVQQIQTDATAWTQQVQTALQQGQGAATGPGTFDPGSAGGGGGGEGSGAPADGGGGGEDPGASDEGEGGSAMPSSDANVQRFRESGGEWDPFADAEEGDPAVDEAASADGTDPTAADDDSASAEDSVQGLSSSDYHFEAGDLFNPAGAYVRTNNAAEARDRAVVADFQTGTPKALEGTPSPQVAARLRAAQKRLAEAKRLEAALRAQRQGAIHEAAALDAGQTDDQGSTIMGMRDMETLLVLGVDPQEAADIMLESWQHEITDRAPDPQRTGGSMHRGAAYQDDYTYPPGGASAGQEGGDVMPVEKVEVFGAYAYGCDVLGAKIASKSKVPPRAGFIKKTSPGGRVYTSLVVNKPKAGDHKATVRNAKEAGARAVKMGAKLLAALHKGTTVHGAISSKRVAATKGKYANMSPAQLKRVAAAAIKVGKNTLAHVPKFEKFSAAHQATVKAGVQTVQKTYGPSGRKGTTIHGELDYGDTDYMVDVLGAMAEALGDDAADPSADTTSQDAGTDPTAMPDGTPYGLGSPPTSPPPLQAGVDYAPASSVPNNDQVFYTGLPLGAVVYQKQQPVPWQGVASYSRYFGKFPGNDPDGGDNSGLQWGGGDPSIMDGWYVWWANAYHDGAAVDLRYKHEGNDQVPMYASNKERSADSQRHGWGPLIGNPQGGWTAGLRYDTAGDQWFWFRDQAPSWATAADDLARLNQAILDYKAQVAAAAADAAAQAAQDKLDAEAAKQQAKQQAAEDAATARRQQQEQQQTEADAAKQAVIDQSTAQQQALADEAAARQEGAQHDQDRQDALTQAEIDKKAAEYEADLEQRAIETEARLAQMQQGGGSSDEGGETATDDTAADESYDQGGGAEDVLGALAGRLRGVDRLRLRRALRRGESPL